MHAGCIGKHIDGNTDDESDEHEYPVGGFKGHDDDEHDVYIRVHVTAHVQVVEHQHLEQHEQQEAEYSKNPVNDRH